MPISATGIWTARVRGFTLLEVLVTLLLVGILTGLAVLAIGDGGAAARLQAEARRLAALIDLHRTEALLRGEQRGVAFAADAYRFLTLGTGGQWTVPVTADAADYRELPADIELRLRVEGQALSLDQAVTTPQVLLLSSGETTEFDAVFVSEYQRGYQVAGDLVGRLQVGPVP